MPFTDKNTVVVLDLDDTIYKEIDFLKSAYQYIAFKLEDELGHNIYHKMWSLYLEGKSTFDIIKSEYQFKPSISDLVDWYRVHQPTLKLDPNTEGWLEKLKNDSKAVGLITDGRSRSQRNKLKALGLSDFFDAIIISEEFGSSKPNLDNFSFFQKKYADAKKFIYIGDNLAKDFIAPNQLGWLSCCLKDNGQNIHNQNIRYSDLQKPTFFIENLNDIR